MSLKKVKAPSCTQALGKLPAMFPFDATPSLTVVVGAGRPRANQAWSRIKSIVNGIFAGSPRQPRVPPSSSSVPDAAAVPESSGSQTSAPLCNSSCECDSSCEKAVYKVHFLGWHPKWDQWIVLRRQPHRIQPRNSMVAAWRHYLRPGCPIEACVNKERLGQLPVGVTNIVDPPSEIFASGAY